MAKDFPRDTRGLDRTSEVRRHIEKVGEPRASRDVFDAKFGRGPLAGRTGNPFTDKPFFNPWAPGGRFNKGPGTR